MKLLVTAILAGLTSIAAASEAWLTNFDEAKKLAKKENKPILMNFTGSDWCPPCMRLDRAVFSNPKFEAVAKKYVLMKVDFPRRKKLPFFEQAQNQKLQEEFGIQGYPTVFVLNPEATKAAQVNFGSLELEAFEKALSEAQPK